jgi:tripartite-type tricarboxylate transporter receptor subunit TctC
MLASTSLVLVIAPSVPATTAQDFVSYAKANPGKLNFGFGQGTLPHLVGELFKQAAGVDIASIPYRGGAQAVTDLLGGRIQMYFGPPSSVVPLIRDGKVRPLAFTGTTRSPDLPEVPTMPEVGLPTVTSITHYGILGPAGLPNEVINRLNSEINAIVKAPELTASMTKVGFAPKSGSPQDFSAIIADDLRKWIPIAKASGFQME